MIAFIDDHRGPCGVEPICKVLLIAPSTYHAQSPSGSRRQQAFGPCASGVRRTGGSNGSRRRTSASTACGRSGGSCGEKASTVARCTVERLMCEPWPAGRDPRLSPWRTTISDKAVPCPLNYVNRAVPCAKAECPLGLGLHLRRNLGGLRLRRLRHRRLRLRPSHVGWRVSRTAHASFVLDALEQASMIGGRSIAAGSYITATEGSQGGFKRSSQRVVCLHTVLAYQALRLAFSSQVSCVVSD